MPVVGTAGHHRALAGGVVLGAEAAPRRPREGQGDAALLRRAGRLAAAADLVTAAGAVGGGTPVVVRGGGEDVDGWVVKKPGEGADRSISKCLSYFLALCGRGKTGNNHNSTPLRPFLKRPMEALRSHKSNCSKHTKKTK